METSERAVELAAALYHAAASRQTRQERAQARRLARMVDDFRGKAFTLAMVDQAFRSSRPERQARRFRGLLKDFGVPEHFQPTDRLLIRCAGAASRFMPGVVMSAVSARIRCDSGKVIVPGEKAPLARYLAERRAAGTRVNLNHLGEAVLGEAEAARRMEAVLGHLRDPAVTYISVKISAIFSQINLVDWDGTLEEIKARLRRLYRAALPERKFVNLDMEEYRDLHLTLAAFTEVLAEPEFMSLRAGAVLQAYLPDSWPAQQQLTAWAKQRVADGGAPVKLRIVKGANLAMETVEAEMHGWVRAPYASKEETDANYKRMLEFGGTPENARAVNLGVASHNLFDVALALVLREQNGVGDLVEMEMLEGMANHQARAVQDAASGLVVYAPAAKREDFNSAMAYLVRRLDENTAPGNFLRDMFEIEPGSPAWIRQRERFLAAWEARHTVSAAPRRENSPYLPKEPLQGFANASDTDWSLAGSRDALSRALENCAQSCAAPLVGSALPTDVSDSGGSVRSADPTRIALPRQFRAEQPPASQMLSTPGQSGARDVDGSAPDAAPPRIGSALDPGRMKIGDKHASACHSESSEGSLPFGTEEALRCAQGDGYSRHMVFEAETAPAAWKPPTLPPPGDLNVLLETARRAQPAWEALDFDLRGDLLQRCGTLMEQERFDSIACMVHDGKKAAWEADSEVSEAIDFANYYGRSTPFPSDVRADALGVVVVAPPWNFPYAIPAGGVLAALMAGNAVILKPAPETAVTAWRLANQLWEAGIPRDVLQFFPCADGDVGRALVTDPRVNAVVLTGAYETARMFLDWRPSLRLFAETSGKNALVITAQADRDLAIKDLVKSAFGHAGQKCSAASLAILEAEVHDDATFRRQLRDAAASLPVGPATNPASVVTPLIRPPGPALLAALTTLDAGEEWLLAPRNIGGDPCLWSPGIKLGVKPGSWFHRTECFGPVLGLIRARDLDDAIRIQNDSAFGLTAGLHSLDDREIDRWREQVESGNAYVNRVITGAVVQRQPFGGWKSSSIGPGAKAGGPNYVRLFSRLENADPRNVKLENLKQAAASFAKWWEDYFTQAQDPTGLKAESNILRYRPCRGVILRLDEDDDAAPRLAELAAQTCGVKLHVSLASQETDAQFATRLSSLAGSAEFLRTVRAPSDRVLTAAYDAGLNWIDAPLLANGRFELPRWLREQTVSETRHRYGLLVARQIVHLTCSKRTVASPVDPKT